MPKSAARSQAVTFEDIRRIALALPEVEEGTFARTSTSFKIRGRYGFARFGAPIGGLDDADADDTLVVRLPEGQRTALLATDPERFFITPHYATGGAVLVRLRTLQRSDLAEIADLLADAWRRFAPKRLLAAFDAKASA
jgi:hypothetical protein